MQSGLPGCILWLLLSWKLSFIAAENIKRITCLGLVATYNKPLTYTFHHGISKGSCYTFASANRS
jgi:hypothetical protein